MCILSKPLPHPRSAFVVAVALSLGLTATAAAQGAGDIAKEANCSDGKDEDNDTVTDCGDADCFADPACRPDGDPESTDARCSDWVDNDQDGYKDCDDSDCLAPTISVCKGSWRGKSRPAGGTLKGPRPDGKKGQPDDIPQLGAGMSVEDLIGTGGDNDGERNNILCSDGIDNDNDNRIDCADFGCRFDPTVTVCQGDPDFRFSVVARAEQVVDLENDNQLDTVFSRLQLRAFGPIPLLEDSFYLLSMRAEKTPRLTFALFQVPVGKKGHYLNVNSGTGGLSVALVRSAHKRLLLDPPYYLYNAFEQGNGVALEFGGPIDPKGKYLYRTFIGGGTGRFTGNVGGRYVSGTGDNYAWAVGGQIQVNVLGYYSRWDSPLLYTPAATTLGFAVGIKYDQRPAERYPALNLSAVFRHRRLIVLGETYAKRDLDWDFNQIAYNIQVGVLLIPKRLLFAADFGEYLVPTPPDGYEQQFDQETQWRLALHAYLWRNVFTGSLFYSDRAQDAAPNSGNEDDEQSRELKIVAQYRF